MKKSKLTPAIIICSMMMLTSNASAALWLDVVKEFVAGGIKTIVMPKSITKPLEAATKTTTTTEAPKSSAEPTAQEIWDALGKLNDVCKDMGQKIPCSIGEGRGLSTGMARDKALAKARLEMAASMKTYVKNNTNVDAQSDMDDAGVFKETENFLIKGELKTEQLVTGAQQFMSYTYIDEAGTELNKGRTVYVTTIVMVMNNDVFRRALEEVSKNNSISDQLVKESKKGIVAIVKNAIKKI